MEELGWVIEAWDNGDLWYWSGRKGWSNNSHHAIRFSRKIDAEETRLSLFPTVGKVSEHMWFGGF